MKQVKVEGGRAGGGGKEVEQVEVGRRWSRWR